MKRILIPVIMLLILLVVSPAFAQHGGSGGGQGQAGAHPCPLFAGMNMHKQHMMQEYFLTPHMIRMLDLSDAQIARLTNLKMTNMRFLIDEGCELQKAMLDLNMLLNAPEMNPQAIGDKMQQICNLQARTHTQEIRNFQEAFSVLTPQQQMMVRNIWMGRMDCPCMMMQDGGMKGSMQQSGQQSQQPESGGATPSCQMIRP